MLRGLRSIIPLSLAGVLAFLGLWWYTARKKGRLCDHDSGDQMLPQKGNGDVAENGLSAETDGANLEVNELLPVQQEVIASTNTQVAADHSSPPLNQLQPHEITGPWDGTAECPNAALDPASPLSSTPLHPQSPAGDGIHKQLLKEKALTGKSLPSFNQENVTPASKSLSETIDTSTMKPQLPALPTTPAILCCSKTKLRVDGERPDPEGEVGEDKNIVHFSEIKPQKYQTGKSLDPEDIHPSCLFSMDVSDPGSCAPDDSSVYNSSSLDHISQLAADLVSEVVSAAVSEVLAADATENNILGEINRPTHEKTAALEEILEEESPEWTSQTPPQFQETEDEEDCSSTSSSSQESTSGEDYQGESLPLETIGDFVSQKTSQEQVDRLCVVNPTVKGHGTEEDQFSPENQQHTVSHREIGGGVLQSTSLPLELQDSSDKSSPQPSPLLTIWEIEVPKHLVGRLIGKQGRYVSYLKETSGAKVFITTLPYTQEVQICHIEGTQEQVETALDLIRLKFKDLELINRYAQPPVASLPALPITSWLLLPHGVTVEVTVVRVASGNYVFLQQHTHPTFYALRSLDQQMALCYSQPSCPTLPAPAEVGVICAAQMPAGAWYRAQVMSYSLASQEVEVRYVDYGGYDTVNIGTLRQIRSDFVALPFQASEVILENIAPLAGEEDFSAMAKSALEELTQGEPLVAQVTDLHRSGIPLVQLWRRDGGQLVGVNQSLVKRGLCSWINSPGP